MLGSLAFLHLNELGGVAVCAHSVLRLVTFDVATSSAFFPVFHFDFSLRQSAI